MKAAGTDRHHHEFLKVYIVVRMRPAVENIHHGHGQRLGVRAADVAVERHFLNTCRGTRVCQRNRKDCISSQLGLVLGSVELDHRLVDERLVEAVQSFQFPPDRLIDVFDRG